MKQNLKMILDFSNRLLIPENPLPWQKEILDFMEEFESQDEIIVNTSGSTGKPKPIKLPKSAMIQSAQMTADFLNLQHGDSALLCMPIHFIAGKMMLVRAMEIGLKLYCIQPTTKIELDAEIDFAALTPMQAERSLFENNQTLKINKLILGGAKVSSVLEKKFKELKIEVYETYAMTETITHIGMRKLNEQNEFHVLDPIKIRQDERNCLIIKTPYFSEEIITNDVVELIDSERFKVVGRYDNIINSGGLKINPEHFEELLQPYISKPFIVHYKSDEVLGQKLVLIIESEKAIDIEFPADLIPKNQIPKEIIFLKEFPKTESGKIKRKTIDLTD